MDQRIRADNSERSARSNSRRWALCLCLVFLAIVSVALVWWLDLSLRSPFDASLLWRNALPVGLFALLLFGLTGRVVFTTLAVSALIWMVFSVNALKELNMNEPLMPGDLVLP